MTGSISCAAGDAMDACQAICFRGLGEILPITEAARTMCPTRLTERCVALRYNRRIVRASTYKKHVSLGHSCVYISIGQYRAYKKHV